MNVLLITQNSNTDGKIRLAVVPISKLTNYNLDAMDGKSDQMDNQPIADQISMIFDRLGLQPFSPYIHPDQLEEHMKKEPYVRPPFTTDQDLAQYLDPDPRNVQVSKIVTIYCG